MTKTKILAIISATVLIAGLVALIPPEQVEAKKVNLVNDDLIGLPVKELKIRGIVGGGAPWVVANSDVKLDQKGKLHVKVKGLQITGTGSSSDGTIGSVSSIWASLTCKGSGSGSGASKVFTSTSGAPLKPNGDANLKTTIPIPSSCLGPIMLIRANTGTGPWIAASGF